MSAKGFLHLSSKESLKTYGRVLENSNAKWATALRIADDGDFGTATSIAVSSVEELIKAVIITMNAYGFEFHKAPMMEKFFRNHQIRYVVAYAMFLMSVMSSELTKLLLWIKLNPEEGTAWIRDLFNEDRSLRLKLEAYTRLKFRIIKQEFEWFEKADTFRQEGMYTDFDGELKSPLNVSKQTFEETINRLSKVRQIGITAIETLESKDELYINQYISLKQRFNKDGYYSKIESTLKNMKRPHVPFESIRAFFQN